MKHLTDANKDKLLAFLRSRAAAGEASLKSWGRDQRPQIPGSLVEEIADALVKEGKATCEIKTHGGRVWRAAVVEPTAPEPDVEEEPEEEPVVVAGAAEPCRQCEDLQWKMRKLREENNGVFALRDHLALARQRCAELEAKTAKTDQELSEIKAEAKIYYEAICELVPDLRGTSPAHLAGGLKDLVRDLRQERDFARGQAFGFESQLDEARAERPTHYQAPDLDPGAIAHYLLELPVDRWEALAIARKRLAEGRTLAERGTRLQESALATVEGILTAPAGEAPVAEEPPPPPSGEQSTVAEEPPADTALGRVLRWLRKRDDARARQAAEALSLSVPHASAALVTLTRKGLVVRVGTGLYRAIRAKEAA